MKNNKELLDIYLGGNMNVGTLTPSAIYDIMASAQVEAIKELIDKVFYSYSSHPNYSFESFKEIALELIKEIESQTK